MKAAKLFLIVSQNKKEILNKEIGWNRWYYHFASRLKVYIPKVAVPLPGGTSIIVKIQDKGTYFSRHKNKGGIVADIYNKGKVIGHIDFWGITE